MPGDLLDERMSLVPPVVLIKGCVAGDGELGGSMLEAGEDLVGCVSCRDADEDSFSGFVVEFLAVPVFYMGEGASSEGADVAQVGWKLCISSPHNQGKASVECASREAVEQEGGVLRG